MTPEIVRAIAQAEASRVAAQAIADSIVSYEVSTTDDTPTELASIEVDDNAAGVIEVKVIGAEATGASVAAFYYAATWQRPAGDVVVDTPVTIYEIDTALAGAVSITAGSGVIVIEVTGVAATGINWKGEVKIISTSVIPV